MKVKKTSFKMETACQPVLSESLVEGRLSLPADRPDIKRVLYIQGRLHVNAEPGDGKVFMDGNVEFTVVYLDDEEAIQVFDASSPFRHTQDMEGAMPGMHIIARGSVKEYVYSVENGRNVNLRSVVGIELKGSITWGCEAVAGADSPELQTLMSRQRLGVMREQRRDTAYIREDVRIPQTLPMAQKVLSADAYAVVRTVRNEDLKMIVEGEIKLTVVYLSADKNAPLQQMCETVPFGQILPSEGLLTGDIVMADVTMADVRVTVAEEAGDVLQLSARMNIACVARGETDVEFMQDAYSLKNRVKIDYADQSCRSLALSGCSRAFARSTITIPDTHPGISRIVCLRGMPHVTSVTPATDRVYIEGLMMFTMCYFSSEGMWSYSGETPFETEVQMDGIMPIHDVEIRADVESCTFDGTGRDISVKFMMDVELRAFAQRHMRMVAGLADTDEATELKAGITIYFADGGESTWDIAKRFVTTLDTVKKFNPEIGERAEPGQKILIMS